MECQDVTALIDKVRYWGSELDDVETKTAQGGMPERIYRSLSALSNHRGGGVILFGVDEAQTDYRRRHHGTVETVEATRELRGLVEAGLVEMHGTRRWAYYTLSETTPRQAQLLLPAVMSDEEKILAHVREHGFIYNAECRELLGLGDDNEKARYILGKLVRTGRLKPVGERRGRRYELP